MRNANQFITVSLGRASPLTGSLFSLILFFHVPSAAQCVCVELQSGAFFKKQ
jgi:hypothetical protein